MSGAAPRVWLNAVSGGAPASGSTVRGTTSWILRIRTRAAREIVRLQQDPGHRLACRAPAPERSVAMIRKWPGLRRQAMEWMLHPPGGPDCLPCLPGTISMPSRGCPFHRLPEGTSGQALDTRPTRNPVNRPVRNSSLRSTVAVRSRNPVVHHPLSTAAFPGNAWTAKALTPTKIGWADLRISRGLAGSERENLLACGIDPGRGVDASHLRFMEVKLQDQDDALTWAIHQG